MITQDFSDFKILEIVNIKRENMHFKTECKDCYVLSCRIQGESTFFYKGKSYQVRKGDVLYIPHGASYYQTCETEEIIAIQLTISGNAVKEIRIYTPDDPDEMCRLFQSVFQFWQKKTPGSFYYCMADLYKIIATANIIDTPQTDEDFGIISPSIHYLQAHLYDTDLSLDAVYRQSPVSQTSFIKHFRKFFNCTPMKYVNHLRIQKAQMLLNSRLYTREEIAFLCGFENVKHFYVVFKKITGCTTGEYVKKTTNIIR